MMDIEQIKSEFESANLNMGALVSNLPWESPEAYALWMAQSLEYVAHTTRILALTGAHFPMEHTATASRFIQHATEEKGHDRLLHNDARALGVDLNDVALLPSSEAFHKSLYYFIQHGRAPVIMGWVIFLEGFAVRNGAAIYDRVAKAHSPRAASFLRVHTQEDPGHLEAAFRALGNFSKTELRDVAHGIRLYSRLYAQIYTDIIQVSSIRKAA